VIPNNKVYLAVTKNFEGDSSSDGNAAKGYTFVWGTTTGIDNTVVKVEEDGAIYNLQGSKVTNPSAGVYIKSGKKIIVK
jgi:isocitrate dehydrogenase